MTFLYIVTGIAIVLSLARSPARTWAALKSSARKLSKIIPAFLTMLILVAVVLSFIPDWLILQYLGATNRLMGVLVASAIGSITLMPGFIAFPLAGILLEKGVLYMVLSAFTTTLMMVGVLTYPVEKVYLGAKVTLLRNGISLLIALTVAVVTGLFFGEIF
jgi:uncharacterized membrane protein YraQ (UPF0718 family)